MNDRYPYCEVKVIPFTDLSREEIAQVERQLHDIEERREVVPGWTYDEIIAREG